MSTTIAIANQKGGVGKTCTTLNLGIGLALKGKEVLLIDLDPQANLTMSLGWTNPDEQATTISTLLHKTANEQAIEPGEGILRHPEGVDLIPSSIQLSGYEANLLGEFGRESVLRQYIDGVRPLFSRDLVDRLRENYGAYIKVFDTEIPTSIRMTESSSKGKSIFQYEPNGRLAVAYEKLTQEVLDNARPRDRERRPLCPAR